MSRRRHSDLFLAKGAFSGVTTRYMASEGSRIDQRPSKNKHKGGARKGHAMPVTFAVVLHTDGFAVACCCRPRTGQSNRGCRLSLGHQETPQPKSNPRGHKPWLLESRTEGHAEGPNAICFGRRMMRVLVLKAHIEQIQSQKSKIWSVGANFSILVFRDNFC